MRLRPRRQRVIALLALVAGGLLYAHFHRFYGGPLVHPGGAHIGAPVRIGKPFVMADIGVDNDGGSRVTLDAVHFGHEFPGTSVHVWVVTAGNHERSDGTSFPPPGIALSDLHQIEGFHIAGHTRNVQLAAEITATRPGCVGFQGMTIDYTTGFLHYRRTSDDPIFDGATPGVPIRNCTKFS